MKVTIISYRVSGLDGVSLECQNWKKIFERLGHTVTFVAGELDQEGILIPELHFKSPDVARLHDMIAYSTGNYNEIESEIFAIAGVIEGKLRELFRNGHRPDLLIVPNIFSLPMHFPLSVALLRAIDEFQIPTIARHHDFWWERERYDKSSMFDFFKKWFPPNHPLIIHTVINSLSQKSLFERTGINAEILWDSFDFDAGLNQPDTYSKKFRSDFKIKDDEIVFLQATRLVPRKRVDLAIELVSKLNNPKIVLFVAGHEGDEKPGYLSELKKLAKSSKARVIFGGRYVSSTRSILWGKRVYSFWDCYINSNFVTYPTELEGFGNQFVEAVYFRKPVIIGPYSVFLHDIAPLGFKAIVLDDFRVSEETIESVRNLIENQSKVEEIVEHNYELGKEFLSYDHISKKLQIILKK